MAAYVVSSFYKIIPLTVTAREALRESIIALGDRLGLLGLIILAPEGVNGSFSIPAARASELTFALEEYFGPIEIKHGEATKPGFRRLAVQLREELVTSAFKIELSELESASHLTPAEWDRVIDEESPLVLDTRNDYEVQLGAFENAVDPKIKHFSELPNAVEALQIPKEKKVLIYCTGGIRCEKAVHEFNRLGYSHVFQLDGGILNYLRQRPNGKYQGECFVFDSRVAVDQELKPSSRYALCVHCGQPTDSFLNCGRCSSKAAVCSPCGRKQFAASCSKDCREQLRRCSEKAAISKSPPNLSIENI